MLFQSASQLFMSVDKLKLSYPNRPCVCITTSKWVVVHLGHIAYDYQNVNVGFLFSEICMRNKSCSSFFTNI